MRTGLWLVALVGWVAVGLGAQRGRAGPERAWRILARKYDKNRDGKITRGEYPRGEERFRRLDRNGDGVITRADFRPGRRGGRDRRRMVAVALARAADRDRDGEVTRAETKAFLERIADRKGRVTPETLRRVLPARHRFLLRLLRRRLFQGRPSVPVEHVARLLALLDQNRDGRLDRRELIRRRRPQGRPAVGRTPRKGEPAPDFSLPYANDPGKTVTLSGFQGRKPVALIFGSYT